jgi:predicted transcriptional regulator
MPAQPTDSTRSETAVVLHFLGRSTPTTTDELYGEIREPGMTQAEIDQAVAALTDAGVIYRGADGNLHTGAALTKLDELGLIGV